MREKSRRLKLSKILDPDFARQLIDEGTSIEQLAHDFWSSPSTVAKFLDANGIEAPGRPSAKKTVDLDEAARLLNQGYFWQDLADHFKTTLYGTSKYCRDNGLKLVFRRDKRGDLVRIREDARSERLDKLPPETFEKIEEMLYKAYSWKEIGKLIETSTSYAAARCNANGLYSMYTRVNGAVYQIRDNPRQKEPYENYVKVNEEALSS